MDLLEQNLGLRKDLARSEQFIVALLRRLPYHVVLHRAELEEQGLYRVNEIQYDNGDVEVWAESVPAQEEKPDNGG